MTNGDMLVSLKEYIDVRFTALLQYIDAKNEAVDRATTIAAESMTKRLESMNEFRDALKDQARSYVTRVEYNSALKEIQQLREANAKSEGKASQNSVMVAWIMAAIGILLSVVGLILRRI